MTNLGEQLKTCCIIIANYKQRLLSCKFTRQILKHDHKYSNFIFIDKSWASQGQCITLKYTEKKTWHHASYLPLLQFFQLLFKILSLMFSLDIRIVFHFVISPINSWCKELVWASCSSLVFKSLDPWNMSFPT